MRPPVGQCLVGVHCSDDLCFEENFISLESPWVAAPIQTLARLVNDLADPSERRRSLFGQDLAPVAGPLVDLFALDGCEAAALGEQVWRQADAAQVV